MKDIKDVCDGLSKACQHLKDVANLRAQVDSAYAERNQVVAALAKMAVALGLNAGLGDHVDKEGEAPWEPEWRNVVYIDLPGAAQCSWHFHSREAHLFEGLPRYRGVYDGHSTELKYERLNRLSVGRLL